MSPLVLQSLHHGLARQRIHEAHCVSCVSAVDLQLLGALFSNLFLLVVNIIKIA